MKMVELGFFTVQFSQRAEHQKKKKCWKVCRSYLRVVADSSCGLIPKTQGVCLIAGDYPFAFHLHGNQTRSIIHLKMQRVFFLLLLTKKKLLAGTKPAFASNLKVTESRRAALLSDESTVSSAALRNAAQLLGNGKCLFLFYLSFCEPHTGFTLMVYLYCKKSSAIIRT